MDFDSIIVFLFIIVFFVLPSLIKQIIARKKKTAAPKTIKKNPSIIDRIGEQIRQFLRDLEEQAQQQKKEIKEQDTGWETLAEDEESYSDFETLGEDADFSDPSTIVSQEKSDSEKAAWTAKKIPSGQKEICVKERKRNLSGRGRFKSNQLQNAIVWSEILSKPIALREK